MIVARPTSLRAASRASVSGTGGRAGFVARALVAVAGAADEGRPRRGVARTHASGEENVRETPRKGNYVSHVYSGRLPPSIRIYSHRREVSRPFITPGPRDGRHRGGPFIK